METDAMVRN